MLSGTLIIVSAIGYAIAFVLELVGVRRRFVGHRPMLDIVVLCALLAHFTYVVQSAASAKLLSISTADWLLWAAWLIAAVYFAALFYLPRTPTGLVLLPIILGLVLGSHWASSQPLASERSFYVWGLIHGLLLLIGTVAVCIGFLAGLMYLAQSYALKHARSSANRLRLPSLEWLERVNSRSLGLSTILIALGFVSGVVMSFVIHRGEPAYVLWLDPLVLSLAAMLLWLVAAEVFQLVYPAARRGRKVAYLTLASFVFLIIALASFTLLDNIHGANRANKRQTGNWTNQQTAKIVDWDFARQNPEYLFHRKVADNGIIHINVDKCRLHINFPADRMFDGLIDSAQISRYEVIDHDLYAMYVKLPIRSTNAAYKEAHDLADYFSIDPHELESWYKKLSAGQGYPANIEIIEDDGLPHYAVSCNYSYDDVQPWRVMLEATWKAPSSPKPTKNASCNHLRQKQIRISATRD